MKNKLSTIFKELNTRATFVNTSTDKPQFIVRNGPCKLEACATSSNYSMKIVNNKGKVLDHMSCVIDSDADLQNRVCESITTLNNISKLFNTVCMSKTVTEDTDTDDFIDDNNTIEDSEYIPNEPAEGTTTLDSFYESVVNLAQQALELCDTQFTPDDAEHQSVCLGFAGSLYSLAEDIAELQEDLVQSLEDTKESISSNKRTHSSGKQGRQAVNSVTTLKSVNNKLAEALTIIKQDKNVTNKYINTLRSVLRDLRTDITVNM